MIVINDGNKIVHIKNVLTRARNCLFLLTWKSSLRSSMNCCMSSEATSTCSALRRTSSLSRECANCSARDFRSLPACRHTGFYNSSNTRSSKFSNMYVNGLCFRLHFTNIQHSRLSGSGKRNKGAVVVQLMSACVSLWISCTTSKKWLNLFFPPLLADYVNFSCIPSLEVGEVHGVAPWTSTRRISEALVVQVGGWVVVVVESGTTMH